MDIEIHALSPELLDDYLYFFDNVAFTDHMEWSRCYCVHFHWNEVVESEYKSYEAAGGKSFNRDYAIRFIKDNTIQGYLAYMDGSVVGWCNANDKSNYSGLTKDKWPVIWDEDKGCAEKVMSVVCFLVAPDMRGKGIATQLLTRVCQDAAAKGYKYVEAYPYKNSDDMYANHHGPFSLYQELDFVLVKDLGERCIVRKTISAAVRWSSPRGADRECQT
jgi:GNAT superfamily N-acetyltransferase